MNRRPGCRGITITTIVLTLMMLVVPSPATAANWFGATSGTGCGAGNMADPNPHTFFYIDVFQYWIDAHEWARSLELDNKSTVNTVVVGSVDSTTDVVVYDEDYTDWCGESWNGSGGQTAGYSQCVSLSGTVCQKHENRYDVSYTFGATFTERVGLACHEIGHSLGLAHNLAGCMHPNVGSPAYHSHDIDSHLNPNYT